MADQVKASDIESWKRVIAELVLNAPNSNIKDCLRSYDPALPTERNIKALKAFRKDSISETLQFLSNGRSINGNKNTLIDRLCLKIKNYFPDICQICNSSYSFKIGDHEFLSCASCGQEVHRACYLDLLKRMNLIDENEKLHDFLFKIPGFCFLCPPCEEQTVLTNDTDKETLDEKTPDNSTQIEDREQLENNENESCSHKVKRVKFPELETSITNQNHRTNFMKNQIERNKNLNLPLTSISNSDQCTTEYDINSSTSDTENESAHTKNDKKNTVCKFFRKGKCQFGISGKECKFTHPKLCNKFTRHGTRQPRGCNKGKKCEYFHPTMCINSLRKSECFDEQCHFYHIKGTVRHRDSRKFQERIVADKTPEAQPTKLQQNNTPNQNFLEMIQLLRSDMDTKISTITTQIQQLLSMHKQHIPQKPQPITQNVMPQMNRPFFNPIQAPHLLPSNQMTMF